MTRQEEKLWIRRPLEYHRQVEELTQARKDSGPENAGMYEQRLKELQAAEAAARIEVYERLKSADLPPRLASVLTQRYLRCLKWPVIIRTIGKSRQWAYKLHNMALDALTEKMQ